MWTTKARTTVHDRHFGTGQVDKGIIDTQPGQCGHQVLDGRHPYAIHLQAGRQTGIVHQMCFGTHFHRRFEINSAEYDAAVGRRRTQGQIDLLARMQADSRGLYRFFQRTLSDHVATLQKQET